MSDIKTKIETNYYQKGMCARADLMETINLAFPNTSAQNEGFTGSNDFDEVNTGKVNFELAGVVKAREASWNTAFKEWKGRYDAQTNEVTQMNKRLKREKDFQHNQNKEKNRNKLKLAYLENDLITLRKQLDISENEFKHKSYYIYFLKNTFIGLLATLLVIFMVSQNLLASKTGTQLQISFAIILGINILYNIYLNRNRHSSIFTKQNWTLTLPPKEDDFLK